MQYVFDINIIVPMQLRTVESEDRIGNFYLLYMVIIDYGLHNENHEQHHFESEAELCVLPSLLALRWQTDASAQMSVS